MARHGISYDDVITAANSLKGQGESVTIENIRRFLGTGSAGTINQHLRRWKEAQNSTQKIASKENVPEALIALVKGLWEGVLIQATDQFAPIESHYQQTITELNNELEKYRNNNQRWQKLFNQWQQEKTALDNEKLTLEQALEFAHKENQTLNSKQDGLFQQLQEKQERINELHRLHQQTQANLEHDRESSRKQRLLDQQQFERERQQLQNEMKNLHEQIILHQTNYSEMRQQNNLLTYSHAELKNQHEAMIKFTKNLNNKIEQLERNNIEFQHENKQWQHQFKEIENKLENKITEIVALQSNNKMLSQQIVDTKHLLHNTEDQNKVLIAEKWDLLQEKSQLEGRLQLQKELNT